MPTRQELIDEIAKFDKSIKCKSFTKQKLTDILNRLINENGAGSARPISEMPEKEKECIIKATRTRIKLLEGEKAKLTTDLRWEKDRGDFFVQQYHRVQRENQQLREGGASIEVNDSSRVKKAKDDLKKLVETVMDLATNEDINERANIKINDELLRVYNDLSGEPTTIRRR